MTRTDARQRENIVNAYRQNSMTWEGAIEALVGTGLDKEDAIWLLAQVTRLDTEKGKRNAS